MQLNFTFAHYMYLNCSLFAKIANTSHLIRIWVGPNQHQHIRPTWIEQMANNKLSETVTL